MNTQDEEPMFEPIVRVSVRVSELRMIVYVIECMTMQTVRNSA